MTIITIYRRRRHIVAQVCARDTIIVSENIAIISNYRYIAQTLTGNLTNQHSRNITCDHYFPIYFLLSIKTRMMSR